MKRALAIALGPLTLAIALGLYVQPRAAGEDRPNIRPRISRSDGAARMSRGGQDSFAFFEFAPAGGAGMGAACACTTPTGAKGETLTFTRASNATCTKTATGGLATTGIANGDLVVCTNDQPRVEYDSNGTLGLLVESSRTNSAVRSQEINNAAWVDNSSGANPTLNGADTVVAPDGTTTAEDYSFPATGAGAWSSRSLPGACPSGSARSSSLYVRAIGADFSFDLCDSDTGSYVCTTCNAVTGSWSRCGYTRLSSVASGTSFIGNMTNFNGGITRSAGRVALWGYQCEAGAYATSYIPTVAASVTRSAENADMAISLAPVSGVSLAATLGVVSTSAMIAGSGLWLPGLSAGATGAAFSSPYVWPYAGSTGGNLSIDATGSATGGAATAVAGATTGRYYAAFSGAWTLCRDASCSTTGALSWSSPSWTRIKFNATPGVTESAHLWSRVCVDPDPTRCR